jgi:SAM-dependent methyltransferase
LSALIEFGRLSAWRDTQALSEAKAREQAERLELRARAADEVRAREEYLDLLAPKPGERVLDVGCGSGVVTRALSRRIAPGGMAVGVDPSAAFLKVAREYADAAVLGATIEFREADCRKLPFEDASFDAVIAATVLAHVPDAEKALPEMVRVTRPGGRVGVFDFDGDCFLIAHPDRELTRRIVAAQCDHGAVNGRLIREMPGLLSAAGVEDVKVKAFMPLERGAGSFYADFAARAARIASEAGAITQHELAEWLRGLEATLAADRFIGGRLHLFVWGTRG